MPGAARLEECGVGGDRRGDVVDTRHLTDHVGSEHGEGLRARLPLGECGAAAVGESVTPV